MRNLLFEKYGEKFVSKWLILVMDMMIISVSYIVAFALRFTFRIENIDFQLLPFIYFIIIRLLVHLVFKAYTGIIRHTSIEDVVILFKTVATGSLIIKLFELVIIRNIYGETQFHILTQILLIDFVICLYFLIGSRFLVKFLYDKMFKPNRNTTDVYIYGAGDLGRVTKRVLLNDKKKPYTIKGFIDDNSSLCNKTMEGAFVYTLENLLARKDLNKETEIILAINNIPITHKNEIAEIFLKRGIVIKTVPPINHFINGEFNTDQIHSIKIEDLLERPTINLNINKIQKELTNKVILVTGAAGSIGSEIIRQLLRFAPDKILLIDQGESALFDFEYELRANFKDYLTQTQLEVIVANVTDELRLRKIFSEYKPDIVFHAAAYKHVPMMENNAYEAIKVNILGTKIIADLSVEFDANKFVMVSTDKAVNPTNVMGATKRVAEMYTQSMNSLGSTRFIITRFGNVLGSNGSVIPLFTKQIKAGGPVTVTHPEITRYFMTISEASQLVLEAGAMGQGSEVYVFDMGQPVKVIDLAKKMVQLSGLEEGKDIKIIFTGLRPGEKLYEELLNDNENTITTHHPKIMRAQVPAFSFAEMEIAVAEIQSLLENDSISAIIKRIKYYVPEYLSNNSIFEKLDIRK
ncbi:MAG: nucleoside-diphosphate sugar epimerase/dehydratase [Bacteroidota bacterium]